MNPIVSFFSALISPFTMVADKLILDKDKYAELQLKRVQLDFDLRQSLLSKTTTPNTDALVKLLVTFNDVVVPLLRPLGAAAMAVFAAYCADNNIELPDAVQYILYGAFPGWMGSRHFNKESKEITEQVRAEYSWESEG